MANEQGRRIAGRVRTRLRSGARRARPFVVGFGTLAACVVVVMLLFTAGRPRASAASSGRAVASRTTVVDAATGAARRWSSMPLFATYVVPSGMQDLVSTSEPRWAQLVDEDPANARRMLLSHIERLRAQAPVSPAARSTARELPRFVDREPASAQVLGWVRQLRDARRYDAGLAARIVGSGPSGLAAAAQALEDLQWSDERDLGRARQLHRLLVEATACRDIELVEHAESLADLGRFNRPVGSLWRWFVNEFAGTERAWQTYRSMLRLMR